MNYWAGYKLVPSDYEKLKTKLKTLERSLLKEVGSFPSTKVGESQVYDLGGNVTEYFTNGTYGYSAYDYYDENEDKQIFSNYTGIRLIKD